MKFQTSFEYGLSSSQNIIQEPTGHDQYVTIALTGGIKTNLFMSLLW